MKLSIFQGVLLGVFGLAALIGVFVFATYSSTGTGKQSIGTVKIWGTLPRSEMQQVLATANQGNPDMKGVTYAEKSPDTFETDVTSAIAQGAGPDLILISQEDLVPFMKILQPISSATLPASTFSAAFAEEGELFAVPDGSGFYGIPFLLDPLILFENRTILSSSGVATPPTTWEALTGLASRITTKTPAQTLSRSLIALGTYPNVHNARGILSALFLQAGTPISSASAVGVHADLGVKAGMNGALGPAVLRFYTQFSDPSKISYTWNSSLPDSQAAFVNGDLALYLGYASEARYIAAANPNLDFAPVPLPQPGTAKAKDTYGLLYAFAIPRGTLNVSGAYMAASVLSATGPDTTAANASGMAPALRGLLATPPSDATAAVAYQSALYAHGWLSPAPADTDHVFSVMIASVTSGHLEVLGALTSAESSLSALLQ